MIPMSNSDERAPAKRLEPGFHGLPGQSIECHAYGIGICEDRNVGESVQLRPRGRSREATRLRLEQYVRARGGRLLDTRFGVGQYYATILCLRHGSQRLSISGALSKRALWCAKCKSDRLRELYRLPYELVKREVESFGWRLVTSSKEYRNASRIETKCPQGHRSIRTLHSLRRGRGCRSCYGRVGETAVRSVFEQFFRREFPLCRPRWLRSERSGRLELDGFCAELKLAFEYQGYMHSRHANRLGTSLEEQRQRDAEKRRLCQKRGVILVEVYEMPQADLCDASVVRRHVLEALAVAGVQIDNAPEIVLRATPCSVRRLDGLQRISLALGLELVDDVYRGVDFRYLWKCLHCRRTFQGAAYYRFKGRGCPLCWRQRRAEGTFWTSRNSRPAHVRT